MSAAAPPAALGRSRLAPRPLPVLLVGVVVFLYNPI